MKTFEVALTKSYIVRIKAEDKIKAKECAEHFTSDIQDISSTIDKVAHHFEIENIECMVNETFDANEVYENN